MGYTTSSIDLLGDGLFRKAREALGVTAFGVNALVLPPRTAWFAHYHERQDELYFVHRGRALFEVDGQAIELEAGGLCHVEAATPRRVSNPWDEELILLIVGGEGGYVGRDGQLVDPEDAERRRAAAAGDLSAIRIGDGSGSG